MRYRTPNRERVRFLHDTAIERDAKLLLDEWRERGNEIQAPLPIELIVETHLELAFEVEDLCARFQNRDILGAIWFGERVIRVDSSLDPVEHPVMLGRYNYTIAHEVGHWRLHRDQLQRDPNEVGLFEPGADAAFVCRDGDKAREEQQADRFASFLLMPGQLVRSEWLSWRGSDDPVAISELEVRDYGDRSKSERIAMEQFCKPLAEQFEVSAQAMRIRLETLELLVKEIQPRLF